MQLRLHKIEAKTLKDRNFIVLHFKEEQYRYVIPIEKSKFVAKDWQIGRLYEIDMKHPTLIKTPYDKQETLEVEQ